MAATAERPEIFRRSGIWVSRRLRSFFGEKRKNGQKEETEKKLKETQFPEKLQNPLFEEKNLD